MATRKKPATKYHHGDLRAALVATAWTVVARHGVEALSLRSVAEALGVSHAAPAHHFPDKAALLEALRSEAWRRFADALEEKEAGSLREVGRAYLAFGVAHPRQMQLMFRGGKPAELDADAGRAWSVLTRAVARAIGPKRSADEGELNAMATAAWAAVHGLCALLTETPLPDSEALRERVLDAVLAGVVAA
jgi:AcrR family transcriptional regulator